MQSRFRIHSGLALVLVLGATGTVGACGDSDGSSSSALSGAGENCTKTADCEPGLKCVSLVCQQGGADCPADKDCSGLECGPDPVCGESCGACGATEDCQVGHCVAGSSGDVWKDSTSGLTWQVTPTGGEMVWSDAKAHCAALSVGGGGWHLPDIAELRSIIRGCPTTELGSDTCYVGEGGCLESSCNDGDLCNACYPRNAPGRNGEYWPGEIGGECGRYFSSSPVEDLPDFAWSVEFSCGSVDQVHVDNTNLVRCVR
jgi:hypothetical protein